MIKWLNSDVIPATYRDLDEAAKEHGRTRVYSVDRRSGRTVIEVIGGRQVQPMFDGSLEERQRLIKKTRAISAKRELKQGWGAVELIIRYLVRQQERAIK